jgi:hypothetical protein
VKSKTAEVTFHEDEWSVMTTTLGLAIQLLGNAPSPSLESYLAQVTTPSRGAIWRAFPGPESQGTPVAFSLQIFISLFIGQARERKEQDQSGTKTSFCTHKESGQLPPLPFSLILTPYCPSLSRSLRFLFHHCIDCSFSVSGQTNPSFFL